MASDLTQGVPLNTDAFKAYDVRGRIPDELNTDMAYAIGRAYADFLKPGEVVVGHDIRLSSPEICDALVAGLNASGVDVAHLGLCGAEEIYFATDHFGFDGGVIVTASHNPADYNGMKLVRESARPVSADTGLNDIRDAVVANKFSKAKESGSLRQLQHRSAYLDKLLSYVDLEKLADLKLVVNPGNGVAGPVVEALMERLPLDFVPVHLEPDGHFPNGVPNPILPENRQPTIDAVVDSGADLGIAWDGDFDRCFLFDEKGRFIDGYYIVGLLASSFLARHPGATIVHDPRLTWNTLDIIGDRGRAVESKGGHAFMKESMRTEGAIYGGEASAHHFFQDFAYCDSGMVPWLLVIDLMSRESKTLSELVDERMALFPCSDEINRSVENAPALFDALAEEYGSAAERVSRIDGLSIECETWRFNIRASNTEPVIRLNVESRGDRALMEEKTDELLERVSRHS